MSEAIAVWVQNCMSQMLGVDAEKHSKQQKQQQNIF